MKERDWFKSWFDSPYYHILYQNRDYTEAENFIKKLVEFLNPAEKSKILDLACGSGRHSKILSHLGFDVFGVDLSENSITIAKDSASKNLHFDIHDMRDTYKQDFFDYEFSLFTSLGYFDNEEDDLKTFKSLSNNLKPGGILVIDFLNSAKVIRELVYKEEKSLDGIEFQINRMVKDGRIIKQIDFETLGRKFHFQESVKAFTLKNFEEYLEQNKMKIISIFGDYLLSSYSEDESDRLIIVAKKSNGNAS